jgi:hypothetical protein
MPVALMGLVPSRAFPSARSRSASRRPRPSLRWLRGPCRTPPGKVIHQARGLAVEYPRRAAPARCPTTRIQGLAPRQSPLLATGGWPGDEPDALLGFHPLQGIAPFRPFEADSHPPRSSRGLDPSALRDVRETPRSTAGRPSGVSISPVADAPALASTSTLMRFFNLVSLLRSSRATAALAHGFTSGPEPRHRAPRTLFGLPRLLTGAP